MCRGPGYQSLQVDTVVSERIASLAPRRRQRGRQVGRLLNDAHPLATAASRRLDQQRKAELSRCYQQICVLLACLVAWHHRQASRLHGSAGRCLRSHDAHGSRVRTNPGQPGSLHSRGKIGILGQEAVARMHGVAAQPQRLLKDAIAAKVALRRRSRADGHRLVGQHRVQRIGVRIRVDCDRANAQLLARTNDAHGHFAAVGYQ